MIISNLQTVAPRWASGPLGVAGRNVLAAALLAALGAINVYVHSRVPTLIGWLPAGAAVAMVLLLGPRILAGVFVGSCLATLVVAPVIVPALMNAAGTALACWLTWRFASAGRDGGALDLGVESLARTLLVSSVVFIALPAILGENALSRLPGTIASHALAGAPETGEHAAAIPHHAPPNSHSEASSAGHGSSHAAHPLRADFLEWLLSEPIGVLLVLPLALHWARWRHLEDPVSGAAWTPWPALGCLLGVTVAIYSGFIEERFGIVHTTLLVLPPAVWLALEHRASFTLCGNLAVLTITGVGTAHGYGPFKDHSAGLPLLTVVYLMTTLMILASSTERRHAGAEILRLALRDSMTGLFNRKAFLERVEQALAAAKRHNRRIGLLFIDLDNFKTINDTLGHNAGDRLLVETASRLQACLRKESTLARFGGDEMIVLVEQVEGDPGLVGVAERIAQAMAEPFSLGDQPCTISCSIGISRYPQDGATVSELIMKADIAMYEVKTTGRNGYRLYAAGMDNFSHVERRVASH